MKVSYDNKKLETILSSEKLMTAKYGAQIAKVLMRRIKTLESTNNFAGLLPPIPGKWHPLEGDLINHWGATLTGNWRIVVRAVEAERHDRRWEKVTCARIVLVEDYHNKKTRR